MSDRHLRLIRAAAIPALCAFVAVVLPFTRDRACGDHLNLLPGASRHAWLAWTIGVAYASGYCWIVLAYAATVSRTRTLAPSLEQVRAVWGKGWIAIAVALAAVMVDHAPPAVLRALVRSVGACGAG